MSEPTARDHLVAGRALIEKPENWIKGLFYARRHGAACFCAEGALGQAASPGHPSTGIYSTPTAVRAYELLRASLPAGYHASIPDFNDDDHTEHEDVLAVYDRAIALYDAEEAHA